MDNAGAIKIKAGKISAKGGIGASIKKLALLGNQALSRALAEMAAIEMGATARIEKCRKTASWANTMPARGALKPAEMAAATPQPKNISWDIFDASKRFNQMPMVPPKCTNGPY